MLTELRIRNFAIIEALHLELSSGLNVLTGETGAGKSIIVGALGVLLGERASSDLVRPGESRATIEGVFELRGAHDLAEQLEQIGVAVEDDVLLLRREVTSAGRARAWINDAATTAATMARIGRLLVDIHGQHEAQSLLDPATQRDILDDFAGAAQAASRVRGAHQRLVTVRHEIATLRQRSTEAAQRGDYLRHVVQEIDAAALQPGEEARLEEEAARLEHADELRLLASAAAEGLEGDEEAVLSRLAAVRKALTSAGRIDPALARHFEALEGASYTLQELARDLATYAAAVDMDPERLAAVRQRREMLHQLTRKYGGQVDDVLELGRRAREELDMLDGAGFDLQQLERERASAGEELGHAARELTGLRAAAAESLAAAVDPLLSALGMPNGRFMVLLVPHDEPGAEGAERVEFQVTVNVGHEPRALARVASGGELSRVMLALKTVLARVDRVPTLIFDEVDAGIGGRVGLHVGDTMRRVSEHHQVLAITHLPQIASRAHRQVVVSKSARGGVTAADVRVVEGEERVAEIARMLGGDPDSERSRDHARELLVGPGAPSPQGSGRGQRRRQAS